MSRTDLNLSASLNEVCLSSRRLLLGSCKTSPQLVLLSNLTKRSFKLDG